jgi:hypothetical protein
VKLLALHEHSPSPHCPAPLLLTKAGIVLQWMEWRYCSTQARLFDGLCLWDKVVHIFLENNGLCSWPSLTLIGMQWSWQRISPLHCTICGFQTC